MAFRNRRIIFEVFIWAIVGSILACKGYGSVLVFRISVAGAFGLCAYAVLKVGHRILASVFVSAGVALSFFPALSYLTWLLIATFTCAGVVTGAKSSPSGRGPLAVASIFTLGWLLLRIDQATTLNTPFVSALACLMLVPVHCFTVKSWRPVLVILASVATVISLIDTTSVWKPKDVQIESYEMPGVKVYPHGPVLAGIAKGTLVAKGATAGDVGVVNTIFGETPNHSKTPIYLVEHDSTLAKGHPIVEGKNLHQIKPWEYNQMFGDDYILTAVARDGFWASNLGGGLKKEGRVLLGSLRHEGGLSYEPLIIKNDGSLYLQDSDPFVEWLANGQKSVIKELTSGTLDVRLLTCLLSTVVCISLIRERPATLIYTIALFICAMAEIIRIKTPSQGDVMIVRSEGGPHELSRSAGVCRSIIESGIPAREGNMPAPLVIIGRGGEYRITGVERILVAGSGARIHSPDGPIYIGDNPLGTEEGIVDARIIYLGAKASVGVLRIKNLTIIGTDSPAKLDWNKWYPHP